MTKSQGVWKADEVALVVIDYQDTMFNNIRSETDAAHVELNTRFLIRVAQAFKIPTIFSTVAVKMGVNGPMRQVLVDEAPGVPIIDRSTMNAWDDQDFLAAVKKTGKQRIIFCALYTEICLAYPVVDAMADGYEATFVVDAVGGQSQLEHRTAVERLIAAGAVANTSMAMVAELFRDWKDPLATPAKEIISWYLAETKKLSS